MDAARERRAIDAFDAVAGEPEDVREARLAEMLADDPALIDSVRALLAAEDDVDLFPTRAPEGAGLSIEAPPPEQVGAYRLGDMIGRGGMGLVYRGERVAGGFEQTVAIKLIRGGLFTASAAEQFASERQILARLHHPHITQLYDGGQTADGQSYIVMELIQGARILEHAESVGLGLRGRLDLMSDICGAIDYAHGQGVVHADIKPSNIIVDPRHGVKLLDFGISGLIGQHNASSSQRAATPMFASPQQVAHAPASTADDIHALGVLLDVLAAGQADFDAELAAIVTKARSPEPADRHASAGDLAADIERWRRLEPVAALPAGRLRSLVFFWRRNRVAVSLWGAATLSLLVAAAIMTALYVQAEAARRQADQRFQQVRSLSSYMLSDLTDALERFPGVGGVRNELARRGRTYLEGLSQAPGAPLDVRLEVANGYLKTGSILAGMGKENAADPSAGKVDLAKAEAGLRDLMARTHGRDDVALSLASVLVSRASIASRADNQPGLASSLYAEARELSGHVAEHDPRSAKARLTHIDCLLGHAHLLSFLGRYPEVLTKVAAALAEIRALPAGADRNLVALDIGRALNEQGDALYWPGDHTGALRSYLDAARVLDPALSPTPDVRVFDQFAFTTFNIAAALDDLGRKREELAWIDRGAVVADQMRVFEDTPHAWRTVNIVHMQRAVALAGMGRVDEAITEARTNIALRRTIAARSPHDMLAVRAVPVGLRILGDLYAQAHRHAEACATYVETRALWDRLSQQGGSLPTDTSSEIPFLDRQLAKCHR